MRTVTVDGLKDNVLTPTRQKWAQTVKVSDELAIHLRPSLKDLCEARDSFFRIAYGVGWAAFDESQDHPNTSWRKLQLESQAIIDRLVPEVVI